MTTVAAAIAAVRARIAQAASDAGRSADEVTLVAVTKTVPVEQIRDAVAAGVRDVAENKVQDLLARQEQLDDPTIRWHAVGTVQRNKVNAIVGRAHLIHGVDSVSLAEAISRRAASMDEQVRVLLQVNTTGEQTKHGVAPGDAIRVADSIRDLPGLSLEGVMTIGPTAGGIEEGRRAFATLRDLGARLELGVLSMGMSGDFEVAIAEGATHVRIGTAIFGARPARGAADATQTVRQGTNG